MRKRDKQGKIRNTCDDATVNLKEKGLDVCGQHSLRTSGSLWFQLEYSNMLAS